MTEKTITSKNTKEKGRDVPEGPAPKELPLTNGEMWNILDKRTREKGGSIKVLFMCVLGLESSPTMAESFGGDLERRGLNAFFSVNSVGWAEEKEYLADILRGTDYVVPLVPLPPDEGVAQDLKDVMYALSESEKPIMIPFRFVRQRGKDILEQLGKADYSELLQGMVKSIKSEMEE